MCCPRTRSVLPSDIGPASVTHDSVVVMTAVHVPKKHEIEEMHAKMVEQKITMADRRHGGGGKSGRYKKHDTARLAFINGRGFHDLRYGRLPTVENQRRLFELPGDDDIKGSEKLDMDAWSKEIHPDPRSKAAADAGLDKARQTTLLEYVSQHPGAFTVPANAPRGAPAAYKLVGVHKHYNGCTVMQMARDGRSHQLKPDAPVPGGPTLHWFASAAFSWRFPQHTRLFLGLRCCSLAAARAKRHRRAGQRPVLRAAGHDARAGQILGVGGARAGAARGRTAAVPDGRPLRRAAAARVGEPARVRRDRAGLCLGQLHLWRADHLLQRDR